MLKRKRLFEATCKTNEGSTLVCDIKAFDHKGAEREARKLVPDAEFILPYLQLANTPTMRKEKRIEKAVSLSFYLSLIVFGFLISKCFSSF
jgi:hypothetical protein